MSSENKSMNAEHALPLTIQNVMNASTPQVPKCVPEYELATALGLFTSNISAIGSVQPDPDVRHITNKLFEGTGKTGDA